MNPTEAEAIIAAVGLFFSIGFTLFIGGRRSAQLEAKIESKAAKEELTELKNQLNLVAVTIGEIKGMFTLKLKE